MSLAQTPARREPPRAPRPTASPSPALDRLTEQLEAERAERVRLAERIEHGTAERARLTAQIEEERLRFSRLSDQVESERAERVSLAERIGADRSAREDLEARIEAETVERARLEAHLAQTQNELNEILEAAEAAPKSWLAEHDLFPVQLAVGVCGAGAAILSWQAVYDTAIASKIGNSTTAYLAWFVLEGMAAAALYARTKRAGYSHRTLALVMALVSLSLASWVNVAHAADTLLARCLAGALTFTVVGAAELIVLMNKPKMSKEEPS